MTVAVRGFAPSDRRSLERAIDAVCGEGEWMATRRFEPTPAWRHALKAPACCAHLLLVAEEARQVVGWCRLFPADCQTAAGLLELGIGLLPEYRGRGLGDLLTRTALRWAGDQDAPRVTLSTRAGNAAAIALFEKCGFVRTGCEAYGWLEMERQSRSPGG